jgi:hypothetical protein
MGFHRHHSTTTWESLWTVGVEPKQHDGRHIRLRGWIELHGGPIIVTEAPELIEFTE